MWPWSRIRALERALENAERDNRLLERRCAWIDHQWLVCKSHLRTAQEKLKGSK